MGLSMVEHGGHFPIQYFPVNQIWKTPLSFIGIILEWVTISFSKGSSWPRDQTPVLEGGFLTAEPPRKPYSLEANKTKIPSHFTFIDYIFVYPTPE